MSVAVSEHPRAADDPRPALAEVDGAWLVRGFRCVDCGYRLASPRPRCPVCRAAVAAQDYGPTGAVWAATVLRAGVPDRVTPFGLAYVDLDDGPRILCHFGGEGDETFEALVPGARVELDGLTAQGDPKVRPA